MSAVKRITLALTGASGAAYGVRLLDARQAEDIYRRRAERSKEQER